MGKNINKFLNLFTLNDDDGYDDDDDLFDEDELDEDDDYESDSKPKFSMSGIFGKSKNDNIEDEDDDDLFDDDEPDVTYSPKAKSYTSSADPRNGVRQTAPNNKLVSINNRSVKNNYNSRGGQVYVIKPQDFNEAQTVTEYLREGKAIVINLEGIDIMVAQRVIDFIGGSCFALDGSLQAISANIFIAAPSAIDVSGDLRSEILNENTVSPDLTRY